jgi:hypothetical protein
MALYLRGKISVGTNDLSPKEATEMSRDIKYIGMDVHKEAIVIAVLNGRRYLDLLAREKRPGQQRVPGGNDTRVVGRRNAEQSAERTE